MLQSTDKEYISQLNFEETNQIYCWCVTNETMCRRMVYSTVYFRDGVNCAELIQIIHFYVWVPRNASKITLYFLFFL